MIETKRNWLIVIGNESFNNLHKKSIFNYDKFLENKIEVGDIVYISSSEPNYEVKYKAIVIKSNINGDNMISIKIIERTNNFSFNAQSIFNLLKINIKNSMEIIDRRLIYLFEKSIKSSSAIKSEQISPNIDSLPENYIVIDFEFNDNYEHIQDIIEVCALKYRNNKLIGEFYKLIKPKQSITDYIKKYVNLVDDDFTNCPKIEDVLDELLEFIKDEILIGSGLLSDIITLSDNMMIYKNKIIDNKYIDILDFAEKNITFAKHNQKSLAQFYEIDIKDEHRAKSDCIICNEIYQKMRNSF